MTAINALLQGRRVLVNGVDVTAALAGEQWLSLSRPKISENGLFPATGELILLPVTGFAPGFFDPRSNRPQWRQGNRVEIEVALSGGSLTRLFTGYILKRPATPTSQSAALRVSIGDELALRDIDTPAGDRAGVRLGQLTSRTDIIGRIVTASGWLGAWIGQIPEHPIAYPLPKHQGSYVQQIGAIAASAGYGLYVNPVGDLTAAALTLSPSPLITRSYANAPSLQPADGSDAPSPKVQAVIAAREVTPSATSNEFVITEQGIVSILSNVITNGLTITGVGAPTILRGIRKRTTYAEQWAADYKRHTETKTVELPTLNREAGTTGLELQEIVETVSTYEAARTGKLLTRQTSTYRAPKYAGQAGVVQLQNADPTRPGQATQPIRILRTVESWTYDGEVPASQQIEQFGLNVRASASLRAGVSYSLDESLLSTDVVSWAQLPGDRWRKTESAYLPSLELGEEQVLLEGTTTISIGAQYRPPEPERHIPTHTTEEVDYIGLAEFGGVASEATEIPSFEFEHGVSLAQAQRLAELHGAILIGRDTGWICQLDLTAEWFNWTPASGAQLTLPNGEIALFLIEGPNIGLSQNHGLVTCSAVELGVIGTGTLLPPYIPIASGRSGVTLGFRAIADPSGGPPDTSTRLGVSLGFRADTPIGIDNRRSGVTLGLRS